MMRRRKLGAKSRPETIATGFRQDEERQDEAAENLRFGGGTSCSAEGTVHLESF